MRPLSIALWSLLSLSAASIGCGGATAPAPGETNDPTPTGTSPGPGGGRASTGAENPSGTSSADKPGSNSTSSSNPPAGASLAIDASVTRVHISQASLGVAPGCDKDIRTVDYDRKTAKMTWPGCEADPKFPNAEPYASVERVLSAAEAAKVETVLGSITYTTNPPCGGYDGREWFMRTESSGGEIEYSAGNINCYGYRLAPGIVDAYRLLESLRGP